MLSLEDPLLELAGDYWPARVGELAGASRDKAARALFWWSQRRAERAHSYARRTLLKQDRNMGNMLAFSGRQE